MITGIHHIAVVTTDIERAAKFYTEVLGFRETWRLEPEDGSVIIFVALDGTNLELFGGGARKEASDDWSAVGLKHIALTVDDVDAEYERISKHGVEFDIKPTTPVADVRIAFFKDPDGNVLELMQRAK